jgi:hypothetical protein
MNLGLSHRIGFSLVVMLLLQFRAGGSRTPLLAQEPLKSYKVISRETYERVLDTVFQRDEANRDYDFVLRFEPTIAPESQIVIKRAGRKTVVVEYMSLSGNIYRKLDNIMANGGKEDAVEMAKLVQVRKRLVEVREAQVRQWRGSLPEMMAASMKLLEQRSAEAAKGIGTITIDGTFYSIWYDQVGTHMSIGVWDHEVSNREITGELELVRWMNAVRRDVEKLNSK